MDKISKIKTTPPRAPPTILPMRLASYEVLTAAWDVGMLDGLAYKAIEVGVGFSSE
jgi:hypothetical protein